MELLLEIWQRYLNEDSELEEVIRKTGKKKWCLYSKKKGKDGERKKLGCYSSKEGAEKREKQVHYFKHAGK